MDCFRTCLDYADDGSQLLSPYTLTHMFSVWAITVDVRSSVRPVVEDGGSASTNP